MRMLVCKGNLFYLLFVGLSIFGGCGDTDSHDHSHDHDLLHSHDLLKEELVDDRPIKEKFKLVKMTMSYDEVRFIMGIPEGARIGVRRSLEWWYYDPGETGNRRFLVVIFDAISDMVFRKEYGEQGNRPRIWEDQSKG